MARPLRIEFPGALYHVTARGDRGEAIYEDDADRRLFLGVLGAVVADVGWLCHAYCLMTNHYHLLIETPDGNLAKGMRQLGGVYTQKSNRRHRRSGHLFQGRYTAILVDGDAYFLAVARYVVLNPVRAGMVADAADWPWSSHPAMIGAAAAPAWLTTGRLLAAFARGRAAAVRGYRAFVGDGIGRDSIWADLNRGVFLGDDAFVSRMLARRPADRPDPGVAKAQQRPPAPTLAEFASRHPDRDAAIAAAHASGAYSYQEIADAFGLHFTTVGRIVRAAKQTDND